MSGRRSLLHDDAGFTLTELLVAIALGGVVLTTALMLFVSGIGATAKVQDRSDAAQRARIGFDRVTALVGAQVCNGAGSAGAPVVAASGSSVKFTANTGQVDDNAIGYELRYDAASQSLWEYRYPLSAAENAAGHRTWAASWTSQAQLLERAVADGGTNVFRYYGTDDADTGAPVEFEPGGGPLTDSERPRVLRIDLSLRVLPTRTKSIDDRPATLMTSHSFVTSNLVAGTTDQGPQC